MIRDQEHQFQFYISLLDIYDAQNVLFYTLFPKENDLSCLIFIEKRYMQRIRKYS